MDHTVIGSFNEIKNLHLNYTRTKMNQTIKWEKLQYMKRINNIGNVSIEMEDSTIKYSLKLFCHKRLVLFKILNNLWKLSYINN